MCVFGGGCGRKPVGSVIEKESDEVMRGLARELTVRTKAAGLGCSVRLDFANPDYDPIITVTQSEAMEGSPILRIVFDSARNRFFAQAYTRKVGCPDGEQAPVPGNIFYWMQGPRNWFSRKLILKDIAKHQEKVVDEAIKVCDRLIERRSNHAHDVFGCARSARVCAGHVPPFYPC